MTSLLDIEKRLVAAEGADRELDALIALSTGWSHEINIEEDFECWRDATGKAQYLPRFTASVDAALAFAERVLPGWAKGFDQGPKTCIGFVDPHDHDDRMFGGRHVATAPTPALAIVLAVIRALIAQKGNTDA